MTRAGWGVGGRAGRIASVAVAGGVALAAMACSPKLPEPDSPGAQLYAQRCNTCHRVYAPSTLKYELWKYQVDRMQGEIVRRGLPPLTGEERGLILDYLKRNSG
jgi:hypothetical protein